MDFGQKSKNWRSRTTFIPMVFSELLQVLVMMMKLFLRKERSVTPLQAGRTFVMGQKLIVYQKAKRNVTLIKTVMVLCTIRDGQLIVKEYKYALARH